MPEIQSTSSPEKSFNKLGMILILGSLIGLGPLAIDMYLPGFPQMARDLGTDVPRVGITLTAYFVGISVGQLFYGPIMDRYGRKGPLLVGLILFLLASIGCCFAPTVEALIGLRFVQALGGCGGLVGSRAMVRDLFPVDEMSKVFSSLMLVIGVAPIIAPSLGGAVVQFWDWRAIFAILVVASGILLLVIWLLTPESKGPDPGISLRPGQIFKKYYEVLRNPSVLSYGMANSLSMAGLFAYIAGSPFVVMEYLGYSETEYAWIFGINAGGLILGSQLNRLALRWYSSHQVAWASGLVAFVSSGVLAVGLLTGFIPDMGILVCLFIFLGSLGFFSPNTMAMALAPFKRLAGSASSMVGTIRMVTGTIASALVTVFHDETPLPMALIIAVFSLGGFLVLLRARKQGGGEPTETKVEESSKPIPQT